MGLKLMNLSCRRFTVWPKQRAADKGFLDDFKSVQMHMQVINKAYSCCSH